MIGISCTEFSAYDFKEVLPEIRKSLNNTPVTLTDVRVGTIENPMGFEDGKVDKTR